MMDKRWLETLERLDRSADAIAGHSAAVGELIRGYGRDHVLETAIFTLRQDASMPAGCGTYTRTSQMPHASVAIWNLGTMTVTIAGAGPSNALPGDGVGAVKVPAGAFVCVPLAANVLTAYGRAGERIMVVRYSRSQPPAAGQITPSNFAVQVAAAAVPASGIVYVAPWNELAVYVGFRARETAGVGASFRLRDGGATGTIIDTVSLGANESRDEPLGAQQLTSASGIYLEWLAGTVDLSLLVR